MYLLRPAAFWKTRGLSFWQMLAPQHRTAICDWGSCGQQKARSSKHQILKRLVSSGFCAGTARSVPVLWCCMVQRQPKRSQLANLNFFSVQEVQSTLAENRSRTRKARTNQHPTKHILVKQQFEDQTSGNGVEGGPSKRNIIPEKQDITGFRNNFLFFSQTAQK